MFPLLNCLKWVCNPTLEVAVTDVDVGYVDDQWVPTPSVCTTANGGVSSFDETLLCWRSGRVEQRV